MDKKEFLLHSIIRAYIEQCEPIGSSQLKSMYDISYSPATIRGYFKKLGDEGYLAQEHISSGRTPTAVALKEYWRERLQIKLNKIDYNKLQLISKNMGLSVFIHQYYKNKLQRVLNIEDLYMILEFTSISVTIRYNKALFKFVNDMLDIDLMDILDIAKQVGAMNLHDELAKYIQKSEFGILNIKNFLRIAVHYDLDEKIINDFMQGTIMQDLEEGLYFESILPSGYIGICHNTYIENEKVKVLVIGEMNNDYEYFYEGINKQ
jgi:heat-inducible transcriptional repressor